LSVRGGRNRARQTRWRKTSTTARSSRQIRHSEAQWVLLGRVLDEVEGLALSDIQRVREK
jgi:hypothetical protein